MRVQDVMHKGVSWDEPTVKVADIARKMRDEDIGSIPIGENDRLIGMVTDRDIVTRGIANGKAIERMTARDVMSNPIVYCTSDMDIQDAVRLMGQHGVRRLPVINEDRRLVGMLSLGDVSAKTDHALSGQALRSLSAHHS